MDSKYKASPGEWVGNYVKRVKTLLAANGSSYTTCKFNDIDFIVSVDSNVDDVVTIYDLKAHIRRLENK